MTIDIITFTETQFAALSEEQLLAVKEAQVKKNKLLWEFEKDLQQAKHRMVKNGVLSTVRYEMMEDKLRAMYEMQVDLLRESLLFYLRYAMRAEEKFPEGEELYVVDYALDDAERLQIVRTYYTSNYTDAKERFEAFKEDTVAPHYLGEYYKALYDYFLAESKM